MVLPDLLLAGGEGLKVVQLTGKALVSPSERILNLGGTGSKGLILVKVS